MIGVPQLGGNEDVFARDSSSGKPSLQRFTHLALVPVSLRTIEVSKSGFQCVSGRGYRHGWVGNQGSETERGHMTAPVVERDFSQPIIRRFTHGFTSGLICILHYPIRQFRSLGKGIENSEIAIYVWPARLSISFFTIDIPWPQHDRRI